MLTGLDRAVIAVADLEPATNDYARLLGRNPSHRNENQEWGVRSVGFRLANTSLYLMSELENAGGLGGSVGDFVESNGEGLFTLGFAVDDARAAMGFVRSRGLDALDPLAGESVDSETGEKTDWEIAFVPPSTTRGIPLTLVAELSDGAPELPSADVEPRAAVRGLDHVVLQTRDIEATQRIYGEGLGLRLALDRTFEARGIRIMFFRVGGVTVEVVGSLSAAPETDRGATRDRFGGLAWQCEDLGAIRARLLRQGFDVSEERGGHKPGTRVCTVKSDTHGVPTLLIGPDLG